MWLFFIKVFTGINERDAAVTTGYFTVAVEIEGIAFPAADGAARDEILRFRPVGPAVRQKQLSVHLRLLGMENPGSLPKKSPGYFYNISRFDFQFCHYNTTTKVFYDLFLFIPIHSY